MSSSTALVVRTKRDITIAPQGNIGQEKLFDEVQARRHANRSEAQPNSATSISSRTGRVAAGPWQGPYAKSSTAICSSPIYLDGSGSGHFDLEAPESPSTPAASVNKTPL